MTSAMFPKIDKDLLEDFTKSSWVLCFFDFWYFWDISGFNWIIRRIRKISFLFQLTIDTIFMSIGFKICLSFAREINNLNNNQQFIMDYKTHTITKNGKPRARYTMKCNFNDGNTYTYRSDIVLAEFQKQGYQLISELDSLVLKFEAIRTKVADAKIFDNSIPAPNDLKFHFGLSKVLKNNLYDAKGKIYEI